MQLPCGRLSTLPLYCQRIDTVETTRSFDSATAVSRSDPLSSSTPTLKVDRSRTSTVDSNHPTALKDIDSIAEQREGLKTLPTECTGLSPCPTTLSKSCYHFRLLFLQRIHQEPSAIELNNWFCTTAYTTCSTRRLPVIGSPLSILLPPVKALAIRNPPL